MPTEPLQRPQRTLARPTLRNGAHAAPKPPAGLLHQILLVRSRTTFGPPTRPTPIFATFKTPPLHFHVTRSVWREGPQAGFPLHLEENTRIPPWSRRVRRLRAGAEGDRLQPSVPVCKSLPP